ncbi:class I adenylate-forming enzyme family protein [Dehalococcoides mccartyi]|uniref:Acyl-CoA synthetase (AMP-forming) / AMP-acid ligase n=1 Tax=Dehalococcoides mccartyi (strain CBDB1) TaxID=255470 RepID=A0A916KMM5_DEHMC|nr:AMP-binding protein [Dehalococcoides mccartyi]AGG06572.1 long-chain-fatty-acid--CoA ligase [Dehalococcoides mccartyi DCMB5]CAI83119.1 acyl-CoA synthetase (AMP-forming) / AMP-acid ligase [Dehalococcoides mccartyi CBDB1]
MNLADRLSEVVAACPEAVALKFEDKSITYAELDRISDCYAWALTRLGALAGERVVLLIPNCLEFIYFYFGIVKIGAVAVPLDPKYKWPELKALLDDCQPKVLVCQTDGLNILHHHQSELGFIQHYISLEDSSYPDIVLLKNFLANVPAMPFEFDVPETQTAHIAYTSAAQLRPQGVMISQSNLVRTAAISAGGFGQSNKDRVILFALPLHHIIGLVVVMLGTIFSGGSVIMLSGVSVDCLLKTIEKESITVFLGVPFIHAMLVRHLRENSSEYNLASLRLCGSAGAPLPPELVLSYRVLLDKDLVDFYGLTESTSHVTCQPLDRSGKPCSVGKVLGGFELEVVDSAGKLLAPSQAGEIIIRGPVMDGIYRQPEKTNQMLRNGWLYTGDIGYKDNDGFVYIKYFIKPMLITKGQNIYFSDLEDLLLSCPGVREVLAVGIPDPDGMRGEVVRVAVVLRDGVTQTSAGIKKYCLDNLAQYKTPREIYILKDLPRDLLGLPCRDSLKQM